MAGKVTNIFEAAASNDVGLLEEAMKTQGINDRDHNGMTPLHHAAGNMAYKTAQRLRDEPSIDVTIVDNFGRLAADVAEDIWGKHPFTDKMRNIIWPSAPEDLALDDLEEDDPGLDEPAP